MTTSLSEDMGGYIEACKQIVEGKEYKDFRRNLHYCSVIPGNSSKQNGQVYIDWILKDFPRYYPLFPIFEANADFGSPLSYFYPGIGTFDPMMLRMIYTVGTIEQYFGSLDKFKICEIGAGCAQVFKIITDLWPDVKYTFIDLKYPLEIIKEAVKYLDRSKNVDGYYTSEQFFSDGLLLKEQDLLISDCAYYECYKDMQVAYAEKVLNHSLRGRIACNVVMKFPQENFSPEEIAALLKWKNKKVFPDNKGYTMVCWDDSKEKNGNG